MTSADVISPYNYPAYPSRHNNLALVPDQEKLLRWFPRDHLFDFDLFESVEDALSAARSAKLHLDFIQSNTDIKVPGFSSFIAEREVKTSPSGKSTNAVVIYSLVDCVLPELFSVGFNEVAPSLAKYYRWVKETGQSVFLKDLLPEHQYARNRQGLWLLDIEPQFDQSFFDNSEGQSFTNGYLNHALESSEAYAN